MIRHKLVVLFSCCLIMVIILACSTVDKIVSVGKSPSPPENQETEAPISPMATIVPIDPTVKPGGDLPAGGCPENIGKIAFAYDPFDRTTVHYGIYLMDPDGSNRVRLSGEDEIHHNHPAWSPERCRIAFTSFTTEGDDDIYVMSADGKSIQQLTTDPARDTFPDWSPDGEHIVFVSYRDKNIRNLFVMNADGSNQQQLTFNPDEYTQWEQWSPVGNEIAYTFNPKTEVPKGGNVFVINADGTGLKQITPDGGSTGELDMAWSPDGKKLYFISNRSHLNEIWEINIDGSGLKQITQLDVDISHSLRVSPDGKLLAFFGVGPDVQTMGQEIYVINVDGTGLKSITLSSGNEEWLDW